MSVSVARSLSLCESSPLVNGPKAASPVPACLAEHPGRRATVPQAPRMLDEPTGSLALSREHPGDVPQNTHGLPFTSLPTTARAPTILTQHDTTPTTKVRRLRHQPSKTPQTH